MFKVCLLLYVRTYMLNTWRSEDNFLPFLHVGSEDQLSVPGLATSSLPAEPSCQSHNKGLINIYIYVVFLFFFIWVFIGGCFLFVLFVLCGTDQLVTTLLPQPPVCQN